MKINITHIITFLLLSLWGCEEYYVPELDQMPNSLVVEAMLTDEPRPMTLRLSRTIPFNGQTYFQSERKASIQLKSNGGQTFDFFENTSGNYWSKDTIRAITGEGYYLIITTNDGETYQSEVEVMMDHCEISDVVFADSLQREINYDYWGNPLVKTFDGIEISVKPETPSNPEVGYLYKWNSLVNYLVYSKEGMIEYNYYCWKKMRSNTIYVYDYNESDQGNTLLLDDLHFLSYYAIYPKGLDTARFEGVIQQTYASSFYYYLEQYTITRNGADFWKSVKTQSEATGKLFDPVDEEIESNVHCTSNPDLRCFGAFNTAAYSKRIVLVNIGVKKVEGYFDVSSFPVPKKDEDCILNNFTDFWY